MLGSLSARLLVLTIVFVALVDVVIVVSSVAAFRRDWLTERLGGAQIASLVAATPDSGRVDPAVGDEALAAAMVESVSFRRVDGRLLELGIRHEGPLGAQYDLGSSSRAELVRDSLDILFNGSKGMVRVTGAARNGPGHVSVVVDEAPLRAALVGHEIHAGHIA